MIGIATSLSCLLGATASAQQADSGSETVTTSELIYLINAQADEEMDGLLRLETELRSRGLTTMIKASGPVLETYPQLFKRLFQDGREIIGGLANPLCILLTRT
ncbi:hypothetical protein [uncultured Boseongicola sp.]|uniref:hypothetical protein n=1 Tax=uncultured Boseongicola sp. TaxID=1648499 RepID=UPI002629261F|nr:hypothetical protein [uncultured Boseongicola sp.]